MDLLIFLIGTESSKWENELQQKQLGLVLCSISSTGRASGRGDQGGNRGHALYFIASREMRFLLPSLCHCSALDLLLKWSGTEAPVFVCEGKSSVGAQCPVPAVLQVSLWAPTAGICPALLREGPSIRVSAAGSAQSQRNAKNLFAWRSQEQDYGFWIVSQLQDSRTGQGKHLPQVPAGQSLEPPRFPGEALETPTQGSWGLLWMVTALWQSRCIFSALVCLAEGQKYSNN